MRGGGRGYEEAVMGARALFTNLWVRKLKMDVIRARTQLPGEGVDFMDVHCITFLHQMALPMSYIYTLGCMYIFQLPQTVSPSFAVQKSNFGK